MTTLTHSAGGSNATTTSWQTLIDSCRDSPFGCQKTTTIPAALKNYGGNVALAECPVGVVEQSLTAEQFAAGWDGQEDMQSSMAAARAWAADAFYAGQVGGLRHLRLSRGLSQTQLAQSIGSSQGHVSRLENAGDTSDLRADTLRKLCEALGVDMTTLDRALRVQEK